MSAPLNTSTAYTDFNGLSALRAKAKETPDGALHQVAQQFEALFLNMMLKSMREASMGDPLFDSNESGMYRDLLDNQLAINMSAQQGIGIADAIVSQLGRYVDRSAGKDEPSNSNDIVQRINVSQSPSLSAMQDVAQPEPPAAIPERERFESPEQFVEALWPSATKAAAELGTDPRALIAQAALETGWGKKIIRHPDGRSSCNLFNIKADKRWDGDTAMVATLEYEGGIPVRTRAAFRSYGTIQDSFKDYVGFLKGSPRYAQALDQTGDPGRFLEELQKAGYATDPDYARKIKVIMQREAFSHGSGAGVKIIASADDMKGRETVLR